MEIVDDRKAKYYAAMKGMELLALSLLGRLQIDPKAFVIIMLTLCEQVADQGDVRDVTLAILDNSKGPASDVRMQHEASICICMISESTDLFWDHTRVVEQLSQVF